MERIVLEIGARAQFLVCYAIQLAVPLISMASIAQKLGVLKARFCSLSARPINGLLSLMVAVN